MAEAEAETNRERFERLAPARVDKVTKALDVLGNCHSKSGYDYSESDVDGIFETIREHVRDVEKLFKPKKRRAFELPIEDEDPF